MLIFFEGFLWCAKNITPGPPRPQTPRQGNDFHGLSLILLDAVVLLARRLKAANPDAKHPGKAGE